MAAPGGSGDGQEAAPSRAAFVDRVVQVYGDLLFDLCESVLWSPVTAQGAFRKVIQDIQSAYEPPGYRDHERAWILHVAIERLLKDVQRHGRRLSSSEQIMLDATSGQEARVRQFDSFFHRLPAEDQILLLLRDKYGLPYPEISTALGVPDGSLKVRRQQALRSLEEWLW